MYCADSDVTLSEVTPPCRSARPAFREEGSTGGGDLTSLAFSKNKWLQIKVALQPSIKNLTFTKAHLYGCPYLAHWQPPLHLVEQEWEDQACDGLGLGKHSGVSR